MYRHTYVIEEPSDRDRARGKRPEIVARIDQAEEFLTEDYDDAVRAMAEGVSEANRLGKRMVLAEACTEEPI